MNHPTEGCFALAAHQPSRDIPRLFNISHLSASKCQQLPSYESYHLRSFQILSMVAVVNIAFGVAFLSGMHSMEGLEHFMVMGFCSSTQMNIANQPTIMANDRTSCHYSRHWAAVEALSILGLTPHLVHKWRLCLVTLQNPFLERELCLLLHHRAIEVGDPGGA